MKIKNVSRWLTVYYKEVTPKHSLFCYSDDGYLDYFNYKGSMYAVNQFIARFGAWGFDKECKEYPSFIVGYDGNGDYYNPLMLEMDEFGEKVRLWIVEN